MKVQVQNLVNNLISRKITYTDKPKLTLEILESKELDGATQLELNVQGYPQSKRGAKDGCCFFGTLKSGE